MREIINPDLNDLRRLEQLIEKICDTCLLPLLSHTSAEIKSDGSIVTQADIQMQNELSQNLGHFFAEPIEVLGEELSEQKQQHIINNNKNYWAVDPLDGTTNFHKNFPIFCTSIALIINGEVVLGLIYDPIRKECFSALKDQGFYFNYELNSNHQIDQLLTVKDSIAFIDYKRIELETRLKLISSSPFKSQRNIGSSALEWGWLALNRAQLSFHGGQKLWDYAAGQLILNEANGYSSDRIGDRVFKNTLATRPIIAASSYKLYQNWFEELTSL